VVDVLWIRRAVLSVLPKTHNYACNTTTVTSEIKGGTAAIIAALTNKFVGFLLVSGELLNSASFVNVGRENIKSLSLRRGMINVE
jgi:hypothetical protein